LLETVLKSSVDEECGANTKFFVFYWLFIKQPDKLI